MQELRVVVARHGVLHRLDDDQRELVGVGPDQPVGRLVVIGQHHHGVVVDHAGHAAPEHRAERRLARAVAGGADQRVVMRPVVVAVEHRDLVLGREGAGDPHAVHGRLGARVAEDRLLAATRRLAEQRSELGLQGVVQPDVPAAADLRVHGVLDHLRAVAQQMRPEAHGEVDV